MMSYARGNSRRLNVRAAIVAVGVFLMVGSCAKTGPGGKRSFMLISSTQEVVFGRDMNAQIRQQEKLLADSAWQAYINELGQKVVAVCDRRDIEYHFGVIESDQVNAFALPGGFVYFYTGLLRLMDDESQLMAVMSHEVSHVVARHGMKRLQKALIAEFGYEVIFGNSGSSKIRDAAISIGLSLVFAGYSRDAEREADEFGIHYMAQAGYAPQGTVGMFRHLAEAGDRDPNVFEKLTSSHPETKERIARAQEQIQAMGSEANGLKRGKERYKKMKDRLPAAAADQSTQ